MNSIISFPDRGPWGKSSYRGNCSGYVQKSLFEQFKSREVTDPMAGSFTTRDVANEMGIISHCYDLSQGFNALRDEIPDEACRSDTWFWHPPYSSIIGIPYAGSQWDDKTFIQTFGYDPKPYDLGRMDWREFVDAMNLCLMKFYQAMDTGARICVLMGDIKRKGKCYSMLCEIAKPGQLENIVIKAQHNCVSDRTTYSGNSFIPIVHEYVMILKKPSPYEFEVILPRTYNVDVRDSKSSSWRDVVFAALKNLGGKAELGDIYNELDGHSKTTQNPHWREKIRQTLQLSKLFASDSRGVWALAAA